METVSLIKKWWVKGLGLGLLAGLTGCVNHISRYEGEGLAKNEAIMLVGVDSEITLARIKGPVAKDNMRDQFPVYSRKAVIAYPVPVGTMVDFGKV